MVVGGSAGSAVRNCDMDHCKHIPKHLHLRFLTRLEPLVRELQQQTRLAHTRVPDNDIFE